MQQLIDGYTRFRSKVYPQHSKLFEKLSKGQQPQALFICCSDSRVMPEMMMQCDPGVLFSCRNAGNLIPPPSEVGSGVPATIEFAVRVLKVPDIVVCGHSDCGAMKGILKSESLESLPVVRGWLEHAGPSARWLTRMLKDTTSMSFEETLDVVTEANVIVQMQNLRMHPSVDEAIRKKAVQLHGWVYDIGRGDILQLDAEQGCFLPLVTGERSSVMAPPGKQRKIA
ncbi:carbonic anhydrase [Edaphobacter albus]|uniref:carbonic anhydrase n=1 Tax=Edaphobacter sp. 4G125 TaxID=2763071 RepID=UPI0016492CC0|nr:carbonic anhydrase [Edaphobacter sp. 4G125]QNI36123.1 carbonic anhydrase [Edaphobacter sp. 4G125]